MGMSRFTPARLFNPLTTMLTQWRQHPSAQPAPSLTRSNGVCQRHPHHSQSQDNRPPARSLRVVRVIDASATPACAGRMTISGRMDDVCAELDRLLAAHPTH